MEIKKALGELGQPQKYLPTVVGGVAGVFGGAYALGALSNYVSTATGANDAADWAAKGGFTAATIVAWMAYGTPKPTDTMKAGISTALLTAAVTGTIVLASKALGWGPVSIGRVGSAVTPVRSGVQVVTKPATPTYARAVPVSASVGQMTDEIQSF